MLPLTPSTFPTLCTTPLYYAHISYRRLSIRRDKKKEPAFTRAQVLYIQLAMGRLLSHCLARTVGALVTGILQVVLYRLLHFPSGGRQFTCVPFLAGIITGCECTGYQYRNGQEYQTDTA